MSPRPDQHAPPIVQALDIAFRYLRWLALLLVVAYLATGIRTVQSDTHAIVLRFGRVAQVKTEGLLLAWPFPIDDVISVPVQAAQRHEMKSLWKEIPGADEKVDVLSPEYIFAMQLIPDTIDPAQEGYCITGDHDILQARVILTYKIKDAVKYKLGLCDWRDDQRAGDRAIDNRAELLESIVMAATTRAVGEVSGANYSEFKPQITDRIQADIQTRLDGIDSGISLQQVQLWIHPPRHVIKEYRAVREAYNKANTYKAEADSERDRELGTATALADKVMGEARDYARERREAAAGRAQAFRDLLAEYRKGPAVVSSRLYLENMEQILGRARVQVVSGKAKRRFMVEADEYLIEEPRR